MLGRADLNLLKARLTKVVESFPGIPLAQTFFFEQIIDPNPILDMSRAIYGLDMHGMRIDIGSYTDGLQVFSVEMQMTSLDVVVNMELHEMKPLKRVHKVKLIPMIDSGVQALPRGAKIVLWKCRGFTRPSLQSNLNKLIEAYNPAVIMLLESRVSKSNFCHVFDDLGVDWDWLVDKANSLCDGGVVLWDTEKIGADLMEAPSGCELRILRDIKLPSSGDLEDGDKDDE